MYLFLPSPDPALCALGNLLLLWADIFSLSIGSQLLYSPAQNSHLGYCPLSQPQGCEEGRREDRTYRKPLFVSSFRIHISCTGGRAQESLLKWHRSTGRAI
ncbi:unnamed protein product [Natator depressus]